MVRSASNIRRMKRPAVVGTLIVVGLVTAACSSGSGPFSHASGTPTSVVTSPVDTPSSPLPPVNPNLDPFVQVVKRVQPAVVNVVTNLFRQTPFGEQQARGIEGAGKGHSAAAGGRRHGYGGSFRW